MNDKIRWLMFYTDTRLWTLLADKYRVRDYVKERVGDNYLVPLLGVWDKAEDIDLDSLPDRFVLKPNNGSYDTIICKNKNALNYDETRNKLHYSMSRKFGYENAEPHYLSISPCIIGEKMLESNTIGGLIDYKIWCLNGEPYCIFVCANRDNIKHTTDFVCYDLNWNRIEYAISKDFKNVFECPKPAKLNEMLEIASKLSKGLPQARIDLYYVENEIYFGEITLSSNFGMMPYFTQEFLNEMGAKVVLPERSKKEKIATFCNRWIPRI